MNSPPDREAGAARTTQLLVKAVIVALEGILIVSPSVLTCYLYLNMGRVTFAKAPDFHVLIISLAIAFSAFISYITWRSYQASGKAFQRWLLLGLVAFTILYAPHGLLTNLADDNIWLFILYGPASRLVMGACFFMAVLNFGRKSSREEMRGSRRMLLQWISICLLLCILVAGLAVSPVAGETWVRWTMEIGAIGFFLASLVTLLVRRIRTRVMRVFAVGLLFFLQSSVAFMFPMAWSHSWWYAHLIFAAGFGLLSYQVAVAYLGTGSFEDVYSQDELLEKLKVANENYRHSNTELSNFAHMVSHDLRAPLNKLSMLADLLVMKTDSASAPQAQARVEKMQRIMKQMGALIDGLLELSSAANTPLDIADVDMGTLMGEVIDLFRHELQELHAEVSVALLPTLSGDRALLFQVFQNLLQNAIRYRDSNRPLKIVINAEQAGAFWRIVIEDNGTGFDMRQKDDVFRMFGKAHARGTSGTGAGLSICTKIVERHGGRITVDAAAGRGARFHVELPAARTRVEQPMDEAGA